MFTVIGSFRNRRFFSDADGDADGDAGTNDLKAAVATRCKANPEELVGDALRAAFLQLLRP